MMAEIFYNSPLAPKGYEMYSGYGSDVRLVKRIEH